MKIIIGAGKTSFDGWVSTQESELNLLNRADFERLFANEKPSAFLAEHVWEHMTLEEGMIAAQNCFDFLADGGYIRAAVPDGNFRNAAYQALIGIGGNGNPDHPAFTHKIVYDYKTLCAVFEKAGFTVNLLEYCDEEGVFSYKQWNEENGKIGRSLRFDTRNKDGNMGMVSIIIDAKKPIKIYPDGAGICHENLAIRPAEIGDAKQIAAWWNDGAVMAHAGFPNGLGTTPEKVIGCMGKGLMVIEESGRLIGECNYRPADNGVAEIGIKLCETDCQNRGVGRKVLSMLIDWLFRKGYSKIVLDTNLENKRAQHVYESLGFKKLRVNMDSWQDQLGRPQSSVDYELTKEDFCSYI